VIRPCLPNPATLVYIRTIASPKHVSLCYNDTTPQQAYYVWMRYIPDPWKVEYLLPKSKGVY
jgi:hypothetical protein